MPRHSLPRITILTPSFNQGEYIETNIRSVMDQDYSNIEHIIIDGGSTDNTLDVLRKFPHLTWVSEKDSGQADALNKGLALATGEIVGWLNADDYYEPSIFAQISEQFAASDVRWVVGDLTKIDQLSGIAFPRDSPVITRQRLLQNPDIVKQPSTFFRRDLLLEAGGWDRDLYMAMDFDLWLRLAALWPPRMLHKNLAYFRMHPAQKTCLNNLSRQRRELVRVLKRSGASWWTIHSISWRKRYFWAKATARRTLAAIGAPRVT